MLLVRHPARYLLRVLKRQTRQHSVLKAVHSARRTYSGLPDGGGNSVQLSKPVLMDILTMEG
jgi:hypothetical protein